MSPVERTASGSPRESLAQEHPGVALSLKPVVCCGVTMTVAGRESAPVYARSAEHFDLLIRMAANFAVVVTQTGVPVTIEITPLDESPAEITGGAR